MNCRSAQRLISLDRDGRLLSPDLTALDEHLAGCADCRKAKVLLGAAAEGWRISAANVQVPDVTRAWQDIRREIRANAAPARGSAVFRRWTLPIGAVAAAAAALVFAPRWDGQDSLVAPAATEMARADFVEVASNASSVVYVDEKSGWLVVWADEGRAPGG